MNQLKYNCNKIFDSITMLRFGKIKAAKEKCYCAKKPIIIWNVNVDNIVISKLVETKSNSKNLIGQLDEVMRPLVWISPKMRGYVQKFKDKGEDNKNNNKLVSLNIVDDKLLEKYKTIWKIQKVLNWIKTKIGTYGDKVHNNFCSLNVPEDVVECESYIDSFLVYDNKFYLQVCLGNYAYKNVEKKRIH